MTPAARPLQRACLPACLPARRFMEGRVEWWAAEMQFGFSGRRGRDERQPALYSGSMMSGSICDSDLC